MASAFVEKLEAVIEPSRESESSENCYLRVDSEIRNRFRKSATAAVAHILQLEEERVRANPQPKIRFNSDREGQRGDVRDVLVKFDEFELGVSCKSNHDAFKHSRLSRSLDFVKKWGLSLEGCSQKYWQRVRPIFDELSAIREASGATEKWSQLTSVPERFYWPVLDAFEEELLRLTGQGVDSAPQVTRNLVAYLVGQQDFYKVIDRSKHGVVEIMAFNFNDDLSVTRTRFPDYVIGVDRLNGGQYSKTVRLSRGFTFNFRIHSASSRVEPSLKFDITAVSLPPAEVYQNHIRLTS